MSVLLANTYISGMTSARRLALQHARTVRSTAFILRISPDKHFQHLADMLVAEASGMRKVASMYATVVYDVKKTFKE